MGIVSWIIVGLTAGFWVGVILKGGGFGCISDIVVGGVGGLLGGFIASHFFQIGDPMSGIDIKSILIAFLGAVILLLLLRVFGGTNIRSSQL
jgi:uncharacterized membrane protein YeaQ/YmgE (transglycosylase-associated protein family)